MHRQKKTKIVLTKQRKFNAIKLNFQLKAPFQLAKKYIIQLKIKLNKNRTVM